MIFLVVGFGKMGMLHAATLKAISPEHRLIIAEPSPLVRRALSRFMPQTPACEDYRQALAEHQIDAAVIAAPTRVHAGILKDLLRNKIHCFVEKPLASNAMEVSEAVDVWQKLSPRPRVIVGHCSRFIATFEKAAGLLAQNAIGDVMGFEASIRSSDVLRRSKNWRFEGKLGGGGVLLDLGSHLVDLVRSFFGVPKRVSGTTRKIVSAGVDDAFDAEFVYDGFSGKVSSSWSDPEVRKTAIDIHVHGTLGNLRATEDEVEILREDSARFSGAASERFYVTELEPTVSFNLAGAYFTRQMEEWLEAIKSGSVHRNTLEENVQNLRLLDAIRVSQGRPMEIRS